MTTKGNLSKQHHIPRSLAVPFLLASFGLGISTYTYHQDALADSSPENCQMVATEDGHHVNHAGPCQTAATTNQTPVADRSATTDNQSSSVSSSATNDTTTTQAATSQTTVTTKVSGVNLVPTVTTTSASSVDSVVSADSSSVVTTTNASQASVTPIASSVASDTEIDDNVDSSTSVTSSSSSSFNQDGDDTSASLRPIEPVKESDRTHHSEKHGLVDRISHFVEHIVKWFQDVFNHIAQLFN